MAIFSEEDNARAAYLIVRSEEEAFLERAAELGAQVCLECNIEGTSYLIYTSDRQLMYIPEG